MTFLEQLRAEGRKSVSVLHDFELACASDRKKLHVFVEGLADKEFYCGYIRHFSKRKEDVKYYICDGKRGVLFVAESIFNAKPGLRSLLFFADKDLDDYLGTEPPLLPGLFVTSVYSIENYIVNCEALLCVLNDMLHLEEDDRRLELLIAKFESTLTTFTTVLLPFIAAGLCSCLRGQNANYNNVDLSRIFHFDDDLSLHSIDDATLVLCSMADISLSAIDAEQHSDKCRTLERHDYKKWLRGKFELWFFVNFIRKACDLLRGTDGMSGRRITTPFVITEKNVIQLLASRIRCPSDLCEFLTSTLAA